AEMKSLPPSRVVKQKEFSDGGEIFNPVAHLAPRAQAPTRRAARPRRPTRVRPWGRRRRHPAGGSGYRQRRASGWGTSHEMRSLGIAADLEEAGILPGFTSPPGC